MFQSVYINNIAAFLPNDPVLNQDMEKILGQVGGRPSRIRQIILRSNGITERYYAIDPVTGLASHTNVQLTAEAVRGLAGQGCLLNTIDLLACGTTLPDQLMPNHAVMVQGELGLPPCEAVATAGICVSGIMALKYAYMAIGSGDCSTAVATGSENVSSLLHGQTFSSSCEQTEHLPDKPEELAFTKDFLRWMLSDGAGAVWMSNNSNKQGLSLRVDWIFQKSYAGEMATCMYAGAAKNTNGSLRGWRTFLPQQWLDLSIFAIQQDVKLLNAHIIEYTVTRPLAELVQTGRLVPDQINWFLPHYSSAFFRDKVCKGMRAAGCDINQNKWFTNLATKGNTGSASMYIMLEELFHSGRLQSGETLLCYIPESGRFSTAFMHLTVV